MLDTEKYFLYMYVQITLYLLYNEWTSNLYLYLSSLKRERGGKFWSELSDMCRPSVVYVGLGASLDMFIL